MIFLHPLTKIRVIFLILAFTCGMPTALVGGERKDEWLPVIEKYCLNCHDGPDGKGETDLDEAIYGDFASQTGVWEKVARQLRARQMPPLDKKRPSDDEYEKLATAIEEKIDAHAESHPTPGHTSALKRLTRTEYRNAIHDLLGIEVEVSDLLPPEQSSHGFDNITVGDLPPALLDRYISAAKKISRNALSTGRENARTVRISPEITQDGHIDGLPPGTRGGTAFTHKFPVDGKYHFDINLMRERNEKIEGLKSSHDLYVLIDNKIVAEFRVSPPKNSRDHTKVDQHLKKSVFVAAGNRKVAVTFAAPGPKISLTLRQPHQSAFNEHRHPRQQPAIYQVSLRGPIDESVEKSAATFTPVIPAGTAETEEGARAVIAKWMRLAYRGHETTADIEKALSFYDSRPGLDFRERLEPALTYLLANPKFFLRVEKEPRDSDSSSPYRISDLELASRLSFFLWSSLPDNELLDKAVSRELSNPTHLKNQIRRMLKDPRSGALAENFASQWLHLKNLEGLRPDGRLYPDFDENLRRSMKLETTFLFQDMIENDRSILHLLKPEHTYLNERLAKHYEIPGVHGDRMRKVNLSPSSQRGGLLRHGSVLTVTSYATRTSPVLRGNWILENLLGTPPPPAPPNIPALEDNNVDQSLPMRQRLAAHREQKACAHCHNILDPMGFPLENFDAIGRWREIENEQPVDASGSIPGGENFVGVDGLEKALLERPQLFARTLTEKLMTYALGRGIESSDAPHIRKIVKQAEHENYQFSVLIEGIVTSLPFTHRSPTNELPAGL